MDQHGFKKLIHEVPNFPIPGVSFKDISPLLSSPEAFQDLMKAFERMTDWSEVDFVVGIESRGFILASALALRFKKGFVPLRKAGKLPPPVLQHSYTLEYGTAALEIRPGTGRVVVVDDVLATGGTLKAALDLFDRGGYQVQAVGVLINLKFLNNFQFRNRPVFSVIEYGE